MKLPHHPQSNDLVRPAPRGVQRCAGRVSSQRFRRGGFLTLGLILCLILILTVAGVLWNYQYLAIQNYELECAARAAIQGTIHDDTLNKAISSGTEGGSLNCSQMTTILNLTTARQSRKAGNIEVSITDKDTPILCFRQPRKMGFFKGVFSSATVENIEQDSFVQYFQFTKDGEGKLTSFVKCAPPGP